MTLQLVIFGIFCNMILKFHSFLGKNSHAETGYKKIISYWLKIFIIMSARATYHCETWLKNLSKIEEDQKVGGGKMLVQFQHFFNHHLPSKLSIVKSCFPSKVYFYQRSSSIKGRLPSKVVFHWRLSLIKLSLSPSGEGGSCSSCDRGKTKSNP